MDQDQIVKVLEIALALLILCKRKDPFHDIFKRNLICSSIDYY